MHPEYFKTAVLYKIAYIHTIFELQGQRRCKPLELLPVRGEPRLGRGGSSRMVPLHGGHLARTTKGLCPWD